MKHNLILCPVDYSRSTEPAIGIAADLAKVNKALLVLLHVTEANARPMSIDEAENVRIQIQLRDEFLKANDITFKHIERRGDPADEIVKYVNDHNGDLVVMGTHGRTGLANIVIGSVAKKVMANAKCSVVTVKTP